MKTHAIVRSYPRPTNRDVATAVAACGTAVDHFGGIALPLDATCSKCSKSVKGMSAAAAEVASYDTAGKRAAGMDTDYAIAWARVAEAKARTEVEHAEEIVADRKKSLATARQRLRDLLAEEP
jgi:hypothetical protein